jgi:hypothetical protein
LHRDNVVTVAKLNSIKHGVFIDDAAPSINRNHGDDLTGLARKRHDFFGERIKTVLVSHNQQTHHLLVGGSTTVTLTEARCFKRVVQLVWINTETLCCTSQ